MSANAETILAWHGPDHVHQTKSNTWYYIALGCVVLFVLYSLYEQSWSMLLAAVIGSIIYFYEDNKKPNIVEIEISEIGLHIGNIFYPYSELGSFRLEYRGVRHFIVFRKKNRTSLEIRLELPLDVNLSQLREYLLTQVLEQGTEDQSFVDNFLEHLKI